MNAFKGHHKQPVFAVVGRINEGKSSIIAALVEDDAIKIGPEPGTTKYCQSYFLKHAGESLLEIIDTPGFQEPEAMLAWLKEHDHGIAARPETVRKFVETFAGTGRFDDECELLKPILSGAYIIYVADGSHPFRPSYEAEIEILRWTGVARLALINKIEESDFVAEWQQVLGQYFNFIRVFDAHGVTFAQRLELLRAMQVLDAAMKDSLERAIQLLSLIRDDKTQQAAQIISSLIIDSLTLVHSYPMSETQSFSDLKRLEFAGAYYRDFSERELKARRTIERLYKFQHLDSQESALKKEIFNEDLFSDTTWQFLGLSKLQLIAAGTATGAATGAVIDASVGGHSFLLGTVIGSVAGLASSAFLSVKAPSQKVVGIEICGLQVIVGPIDFKKAPNFPWIVLDRALLHYQSLMSRTHAARYTLDLSDDALRPGLVATMNSETKGRFRELFRRLYKSYRAGKVSDSLRKESYQAVLETLKTYR
jgi:hypothetical protein